MTQHWAEKLADSLLFNGFIKESDKEIYSYHIQIFLEKIIGFSVIFLISFWIKKVGQTILFVFYFSCIRKRAGGFHANSFIGCFIGTIGIYVVYSYVIFLYLAKHMCINITLVIAATIIIEIIGAVNHPNMEWSRKEYENSQRIAKIIALIECGSILIFFFGKIETSYILYMSFGIILSAILLALGKIIGQEVKAV